MFGYSSAFFRIWGVRKGFYLQRAFYPMLFSIRIFRLDTYIQAYDYQFGIVEILLRYSSKLLHSM